MTLIGREYLELWSDCGGQVLLTVPWSADLDMERYRFVLKMLDKYAWPCNGGQDTQIVNWKVNAWELEEWVFWHRFTDGIWIDFEFRVSESLCVWVRDYLEGKVGIPPRSQFKFWREELRAQYR